MTEKTNDILTEDEINEMIDVLNKSALGVEVDKLVRYIVIINADRRRLELEVERLETEMRMLTYEEQS